MGWARSTYGERRSAYTVLVRKPEGKGPLGRHRSRWEDNIKMDLQEVEWALEWISLAQSRDSCRALASAIKILRVP